jgi:hypothetical protein
MAVIDVETGELWERPYLPYSPEHVLSDADTIERELDSQSVLSMPIPYGLPPQDRADSIDHYGRVVAELKRRRMTVRLATRNVSNGTVLFVILDDT